MKPEASEKDQRGRKKILFFSAFFRPYVGGAEVFVEEVSRRLVSLGWDVTVLTARLSPSLTEEESSQGVRIVRIGLGIRLDKYLYPCLAFWKSLSIPHDIIYAVLESYAGLAAALYKLFTRRPTVLNIQSGTLDDWKRGLWLNLLFRRFIHTMPDKVHAISKHLAERARRLGAKRVAVIPNGIDLKKFSISVPRDPRKIVCVGRLYAVKGQQYLVEAMPEVLKKFPDAKLHLVGDGPDRERLAFSVERLGLKDQVVFRGNLPHEEIPKEVASAAVFVGPSLREGQGIAFVEAQALGTPVIGTSVGGIPEVIEDNITGVLVPPQNSKALAGAIIKLLGDPAYAKKLADEGKKRVTRYDWDVVCKEVERLMGDFLRK